MNPRKKFLSFLTTFEFILGLGLLSIFIIVKPIGLKSFFLLLGLSFAFLAVYRWLSFAFTSLPEGHCKRLGGSLIYIITGIYFITNSRSIIWVALVWILIIAAFFVMIISFQRILIEVNLLRKLLRDYKKGNLPDLTVPFAYIHVEAGLGEYFSRQLVGRIMRALWEYQYLSPKSGLTVYTGSRRRKRRTMFLWKHRHRGMMFFLSSDAVSRYSSDFRKWLFSYAAAFIVLLTPLGEDEQYSESFDKEADIGYQRCPGPAFTIWIHPLGKGESNSFYNIGDQILESSWGPQNCSFGSVIAPLSNRLASTALPIASSDSRLSLKRKLMIQEIAKFALPPVANSYLHFRLSQSDVERFMSLIDCIDCLIRFSVIILLANRWDQTGQELRNKELMDKKLTLGSWVKLLRGLVKSPAQNELDKEICFFWKKEIFNKQNQLIKRVNEAGLHSLNCEGNNQIDWLNWFTDFRNVTRGHGVVDEKSISPFWHLIHEIFLEIVSELRPLVISPRIVAVEPSGKKGIYRGWLREKLCQYIKQKYPEHEAFVFLELESNRMLFLYPLIVVKKPDILVFDHMSSKEKNIVFLNYMSGERNQVQFTDFSDMRPYNIWRSRKQQIRVSGLKEKVIY